MTESDQTAEANAHDDRPVTAAPAIYVCHECGWQGNDASEHSGENVCEPGASLAVYLQ